MMVDVDMEAVIKLMGLPTTARVFPPAKLKGLVEELQSRDRKLTAGNEIFLAELTELDRAWLIMHANNHFFLVELLDSASATVWDSAPPASGTAPEACAIIQALGRVQRPCSDLAVTGFPRQRENECALRVLRQLCCIEVNRLLVAETTTTKKSPNATHTFVLHSI